MQRVGLFSLTAVFEVEIMFVHLKRKSFFLMRRERAEIILDDGFVREVEKTFRAAIPLMDYICFAQDIEI